jgi:1-acyl-sn-glycerol-3-phosphate acyltransferase
MPEDCTGSGPESTGFARSARVLGELWLRLFGWKLHVRPAVVPLKFVFIAAPHTSAWDLPFMLATACALEIRIAWLGKHTLFGPVLGRLLRSLGGIPIDRRAAHDVVSHAAEMFGSRERLVLGVPPEGTRRKVTYWKSGFYHIALRSGVPIGLGFLDYGNKRCGLGPLLTPTGDVRRDMEAIRAFYRDIRGKNPGLQSEPRLREED